MVNRWLVHERFSAIKERAFDFHADSLGLLDPLIVLQCQFIPGDLPLFLYYSIFHVILLFFVKDRVQEVVARHLVHRQNPLGNYIFHLLIWHMIEQIPFIDIQVLISDGLI